MVLMLGQFWLGSLQFP